MQTSQEPTRLATGTSAPIGLIVPPASGAVPPDAALLYPNLTFLAHGLGVIDVSPDGFNSVIDRIGDAATALVGRGARTLALMGTSLSFYRGITFNSDLEREIETRTGCRAVTMSTGIVAACHTLGMTRLAVATAYQDVVNERLVEFLADAGLTVASLKCLGISTVAEVHRVPEEVVTELGRSAFEAAEGVDGILISCGGLATRAATYALEAETGLPVVTSPRAGLWAAVATAGIDPRVEGHGRLFQFRGSDMSVGSRDAAHRQ